MIEPGEWSELAKYLGVALPLVIILLYLLRQATEERRLITAQFIEALTQTLATSAASQEGSAAALHDVASAMRDNGTRMTDEHNRIVDAIGTLTRRAS